MLKEMMSEVRRESLCERVHTKRSEIENESLEEESGRRWTASSSGGYSLPFQAHRLSPPMERLNQNNSASFLDC